MPNCLAINGGMPTVTMPPPHYSWPVLTETTKAAVLRQLDESISIYDRSGIIARLESRLAAYHGRKHALLFNSGTSALLAMYIGAGFSEGDEVICPAYTFFATVTPLFHTGATPILVDCDSNGNIDPEHVVKAITPRTKGVVVTHMWGHPCDMDGLGYLSKRYGIPLLEDGSHAHGARYDGEVVGSFGLASAFSLQGSKTLTGGEGGVLLTDDDGLFYRALALGHYNKRCKSEIPASHLLHQYATTGSGLKLRIHPLAAAIADEQLDHLDAVIVARNAQAAVMVEGLTDIPGFTPPRCSSSTWPSWYAFVIRYDPSALGRLTIGQVHNALLAEGCVEADRPNSTQPLNLLPLFQEPHVIFPKYRGRPSCYPGQFPKAEAFHASILKIPVWHRIEDSIVATRYCDAFRKISFHHNELITSAP